MPDAEKKGLPGITKKRKRKTENGRLFGGNMPRKRLLGIPKKVEELPDFGLFGGNFQNRRKSLKRNLAFKNRRKRRLPMLVRRGLEIIRAPGFCSVF